MSHEFLVDRSRILDFQACPRKRFYGYHYKGNGIQKINKSLPLVFGDAFHQAAEVFLAGGDVEVAVTKAINFLNLTFSLNGVDMGDNERTTTYGVAEQRAIVEGLIRGWCIYKRESFLETFEVIEVEKEGRAELTNSRGIVLMFRPDALVREKETGDLYIVSWKTASVFGEFTTNQMLSDMQSMSEVWGVKAEYMQTALCDEVISYEPDAKADFKDMSIEGVLYLIAVKGQRRMDDYLGFKVQNTPLAYGWVRKGVTEDEDEWAWEYAWKTEEFNPKTGKNIQTRLGKGFKKVPIWSDYPGGVKAWIDDLSKGRVSPRHINPFEAIFPESLPVTRRADEIESWRRQIVSQEGRVEQRVLAYETAPVVEVLDREFPQHTARCFDYRSKCQFYSACFTPSVTADPLASGLYKIRSANHPEKGEEDE